MVHVYFFMSHFLSALGNRLVVDGIRYQDTWLKRGQKGQEQRFLDWFEDRFLEEYHATGKMNWLKLAGEAMIGYIRENPPYELVQYILTHPEYRDGFPNVRGEDEPS